MLSKKIKDKILIVQKNEITEYYVYKRLSNSIKNPHNKKILDHIAEDELKHYKFWRKYLEREVKPYRFKFWKYFLISKIFGLTFGIKLMEKGEEKAQVSYDEISKEIPEAKEIFEEENEHENELVSLINEERLSYIGSVVLGLNDALVELTGALAGFTLALKDSKLIALVGLITGIAASFSMAASEYLSTKSEDNTKNPVKSSIYTGFAYLFTVFCLILPFLFFVNVYISLACSIIIAVVIIIFFTFYISIAEDISFKKRFSEMAFISLGVATLTFIIGFFMRQIWDIDL